MKHIKTLNTKNLKDTMKTGGCGECQTSCQSACKTSCTVGNQSCENKQIIRTQNTWLSSKAWMTICLIWNYINKEDDEGEKGRDNSSLEDNLFR